MDDDYLAARDRLDPTSRIYAIIRDYADLHQVSARQNLRAARFRAFTREHVRVHRSPRSITSGPRTWC